MRSVFGSSPKMKITYLELNKYKRFKLSRVERLIYRPAARQQLILGTNGCGKSSLLAELSPLPGSRDQYKSGGSKIIHIEHGTSNYVLTSDFSKGQKHSFLKDGVEMNEGGTQQVQLRLVKDEFKYTRKLHDFLTDVTRFVDLRPQERREFITMFSDMDWTFALNAFQDLKSRARDAQGAFKHVQSRLAKEAENLSHFKNTPELQLRATALRDELHGLLVNITPNVPEYSQLYAQLEQHYIQTAELSKKTLSQVPGCIYDGRYKTIEDIDSRIQQIRDDINNTKFTLDRASKDHHELESILSSFGGRSIDEIENVDQKIDEITQALNRLKAAPAPFAIQSAKRTRNESELVLSELQHIMQVIPDNSTARFSMREIEATVTRLTETQHLIDKLSTQSNRLYEHISHLKGKHDSTCPKCQFVWKDGVNPVELKALEEQLASLPQKLSEAREEQARCKEYLEEAESYKAIWGRFKTLHTSYIYMRPLTVYLMDNDCMTHNPQQNLHILKQWRDAVDVAVEIETLTEQLEQLQQIKSVQEHVGDSSKIFDRMRQLELEIAEATPKLHQLNEELRVVTSERNDVIAYINRLNEIDGRLGEWVRLVERALTSIKNKILNEAINKGHLELATLQKEISDHETLSGIVKDLRSQTLKLDVKFKALSLMVNALSPTDGLIAERLRDQINSIVDQVNAIIAPVWSYDLSVMPCGVDATELDYKFPVYVQSPTDISNDISETSKGQTEIINLAFKLAGMLFMNMMDYPLYLDEPGEGFDEQHRDQIMSMIRQMLDNGHYSQMFMVSHVANSHGAFLDAECLVLDSSNITLPGRFNEHVEFE